MNQNQQRRGGVGWGGVGFLSRKTRGRVQPSPTSPAGLAHSARGPCVQNARGTTEHSNLSLADRPRWPGPGSHPNLRGACGMAGEYRRTLTAVWTLCTNLSLHSHLHHHHHVPYHDDLLAHAAQPRPPGISAIQFKGVRPSSSLCAIAIPSEPQHIHIL